ncbi:helix-turn-helix domain-containing protein [Azoarcus indigens]|nr:helix-turn-helix transcriptional regulator [Azoarcus indigens]NMG64907.1 helix-turn-helix domain-containing protein [Azoarcus indigens]
MEELSQRIKRLRGERNLTQAQLADELRVSRVAVTKWESGETSNLKLDNLTGLCRLFGLSVDQFLSGTSAGVSLTAYDMRQTTVPVEAHDPRHSVNAPSWAASEQSRTFPADMEMAYRNLTDQGQELVRIQLKLAIETARQMHGERSKQTAA